MHLRLGSSFGPYPGRAISAEGKCLPGPEPLFLDEKVLNDHVREQEHRQRVAWVKSDDTQAWPLVIARVRMRKMLPRARKMSAP